MRILFFTEHFAPEVNAAASRVYERACYWVKWGHDVTILTSVPNFPDGIVFEGYENRVYQTEEMNGIRVVRVKTFISRNRGFLLRTLDFMSYMGSAYLAGLFERRPDVIIASSPQFFAAIGGWALAATRGIPFIFELADLWPASIAAVGAMKGGRVIDALEQLELFLYRRASAIIALTPAFKRDLVRRGISESKIAVVINGVDLSRYEPRPRDEVLAAQLGLTGHFVIGYLGTIGMAHDLENVVAAAHLVRHRPEVRFLFVGPGAEREVIMARAREQGLENMIFVPRQPKEAMPSYWSLCDVALVHLKNHAVFETVIPSKIFEAMGMGLPVLLVAPEGEASAIVRREHVGPVVPAGDPQLLADAVSMLASDPVLRATMARASLTAAPRYSRERQARDVVGVAASILDGRPTVQAPRTTRDGS